MTTALTTTHTIPAPTLEVIPADQASRGMELVNRGDAIAITDSVTYEHANGLLMELHRAEQLGEKRKKEVLHSPKELVKVIGEICEKHLAPITRVKGALKLKVEEYKRKVQAEQDEIDRRAFEAKRKADQEAEAERARLQKIEDDKHAAEVARLQREAKAKAEADAKERAAMFGEEPPAVVKVPEVVAPAKVVVEVPKSTAVLMPQHQPLAPSATTTRKMPKLVIFDPRACAKQYIVGNTVLVKFAEAEIKKLIEAGCQVDGCRIDLVEETAMRRGSA
jgi:hypothetical protein